MKIRTTKKRNSARRAATFLAVLGALVMSSGVALMASTTSANAADCVPQAASTETINHPAGTHVVHHDAVTHVVHHAAVPGPWWNWSPNKQQKPFNGPPAFPNDPRGTWQGPHINGGPSQGTIGTFHQGKGHGSWFHREAGQAAFDETVVDQPASDETVTDESPWVETINHPAVTCPVVSPPQVESNVVVSPPKAVHHTKAKAKAKIKVKAPVAVVTPTVVHAGLASASAQGMRGEQGLALMVSGMMLLGAAGGLGLRVRSARSRI